MTKTKRILGIAFWKYHLFPFVVSAGPYTARAGDEVYLTGYECWHNPDFTLDVEHGEELQKKLIKLTAERRLVLDSICKAYQALVKEAVQDSKEN